MKVICKCGEEMVLPCIFQQEAVQGTRFIQTDKDGVNVVLFSAYRTHYVCSKCNNRISIEEEDSIKDEKE